MTYGEVLKLTYDILVEAEDIKSIIDENKNFQLLDIRKNEDYAKDHLKNTYHCQWDEVEDFIKKDILKKDIPVAVICYTGQSSMQVATILRLLGYEAYSLHHGYEKYKL